MTIYGSAYKKNTPKKELQANTVEQGEVKMTNYDLAYDKIIVAFNLKLAPESETTLKGVLKWLYNKGAADYILAIDGKD